jgi:hypothetical protein
MSTTPGTPRKPTHAIWQVHGDGEKKRWRRVGAAWLHKDTKGANLEFDSFPLSGRVVLREIKNDNAAAPSEGGAE